MSPFDSTTIRKRYYASDSLEGAALSFIRKCCEGLRFDKSKAVSMKGRCWDICKTSLCISLTAILMHNSLYKFCIANPKMDPEKEGMHITYKGNGNKPFK